MSWKTKLFIVAVMLAQIWDIRRTGNKIKEAKQKEDDERRSKFSPSPTPTAAAAAANKPDSAVVAEPEASAPPAKAAASTPSTPASSTVRKANSLELWVSRQKKLNRSRLIQRKLERGLNKHERDAVLKLCIQSMIEAQQAREILSADQQNFVDIDNEAEQGVVGTDRREVSVRKVLAERLGAEVQIRDYVVMKTTLRTNTSDTNEWIQESRQILQSRADPSRRVQMDIRTRIVEMKDAPSTMDAEEGLILVNNGRDLMQELVQLVARPPDHESDSRIATYIEKVDMSFGPSMCLEFEFDHVRIS